MKRHRHLLSLCALLALTAAVYWPLLAGQVLGARDVFRLFVPDTAFLKETLAAGEWPLWTPYQRLGQPFLATLHSQAAYPPRWVLTWLFAAPLAVSVEQVLHAVWAAVGMALLTRRLGCSSAASGMAALAWGLGPLLTHLGAQQNVMNAAAWTGFIAAAALRVGRERTLKSVTALALTTAASFLAGSPETLLWQGLLAFAAAVAAQRGGAVKGGGLAVAGGAWAGLLGAVAALPAWEFARQSTRALGMSDALEWSLPWAGLLSLGWLNADLPRAEYWGAEQAFVPTLFSGTLVCALALFAVARRPERRSASFAVVGLVLALLALGSHFPPAAWVLRLPPFGLFRYPSKYVVGAAFCAVVLAALGLDRLAGFTARKGDDRRLSRASVLGAVALGVGTFALAFLGPLREGALAGWAFGAFFLAVAAALWWVIPARSEQERLVSTERGYRPFRRRGRSRADRMRWAVGACAVVELAVAHALMGMPMWVDAEAFSRPSPLVAAMAPGYSGRVSIQLEDDVARSGLSGFEYITRSREALVPLRFVEEQVRAVEGYGEPTPALYELAERHGGRAFYDLAGAGYFVRRPSTVHEGRAQAQAVELEGLELIAAPQGLPKLFRSTTALPRAFVVHQARKVSDEAALDALATGEVDFRRTVLLQAQELSGERDCEQSSARLVKESPNRLELLVDACTDGFLVLTDSFAPGWRALLDDRETKVLRANYLVRAVAVPKGHHRVSFVYRPRSFTWGAAISGMALLLALGALTGLGASMLRNTRSKAAALGGS